uniref:RGS domain-containing protein n=2 Tax=Gossypium raimondii TaxID=29730 RepID=A0A0D2RGF4_GOSRA|nr:hypothetical protein B456_008G162700 [Gossypium raimondii]
MLCLSGIFSFLFNLFISLFFVSLFCRLIGRSTFPFFIHKVPIAKGSAFWIPVIQVIASFNFLLAIVMAVNFLKYKKSHWWLSCYVWAVWLEGPLGFGLLMSCRIAQAFQLYYVFVKRRLPPIRSHMFLPLILLPWVAGAAVIHEKKPLNYRCHFGTYWTIPVVCLHSLYVAVLMGFTRAIRHIEFRFHELRDLWQGILGSASVIGVWVFAYILNEIHDDISWLQVASRFMLLLTASILVLVFFSISIAQPLLSQISLRKREPLELKTMGQVLGIPESGLLLQREQAVDIDPNEPLDKLLLNKRFRQSFMAFADSCLAGESVHFFDEVHELGKIPIDDPVRRIYMARHIINKYIIAGAAMEVNISHRIRQEILATTDLTHPDLFTNALHELTQLMKMNLAKDYWSSMYFIKFKEEARMRSCEHEMEEMRGYDFSPRLSSVNATDDPFHQDHFSRGFTQHSHASYLR